MTRIIMTTPVLRIIVATQTLLRSFRPHTREWFTRLVLIALAAVSFLVVFGVGAAPAAHAYSIPVRQAQHTCLNPVGRFCQ
jgi:hypothetical protein